MRCAGSTTHTAGWRSIEVKALAGYLEAANDDLLEFALVLNGPGYVTTDGYVSFWSALAERLAAHPTAPDSTSLGPR